MRVWGLPIILLAAVLTLPVNAGEPTVPREVSFPVEAKSGVLEFIEPGDHVTIALTYAVGGVRDTSIIVDDLPVIALEQRAEGWRVTIKADDWQAKKLAAAQRIGLLWVELLPVDQPCSKGVVVFPGCPEDRR